MVARKVAIETLLHALGHTLSAPLLKEALTHRSVGMDNNERLELLGDAVLSLAIMDLLLAKFPEAKEGQLSRLRANLVQEDSLAEIASTLDLGALLILGEGEVKAGGRHRVSILADALEALIGAVFTDAGFIKAKAVVSMLFQTRLEAPDLTTQTTDYKTALQEVLQAKRMPLPLYELLKVTGLKHAQTFHVCCVLSSLHMKVDGTGRTRRKAEQTAAKAALDRLQSMQEV